MDCHDLCPVPLPALRKDAKSFPFYTYPVKSVGVVDTLADAVGAHVTGREIRQLVCGRPVGRL